MNDSRDRPSYRLSVVWFSDLVGYSSLAARDQDRAMELVHRFQDIVARMVGREDGRVVKFVGDAALIESPSAEAALQAATALHDRMGEALRTGIHLGDVVVGSDGDLYGDGVNGAQRIQSEAEPGQIVVSEDVWRRLRNRPAFVFESLGQRELKGVEPMELFRALTAETGAARVEGAGWTAQESDSTATPQASVAAAPSVAVLPFTNMSPLADNEYFSDGVTEEILALLARIEGLKVISRTSVMQYKGTVKPIRQIGEELGVGTILEGSVRQAGQRVRITAQLIDAGTDEHLWADRYDRDLEDIFEIQTDVAERIVEALRLRLTSRERSQLAERPTESVEAHEWYLKGRHFLSRRTEASLRQAIARFRKAVAADPAFAQAWVGLADGLILLPGYSSTPLNEVVDEAREAASRALNLQPRLGEAHVSLGMIATSEGNWEEAERHFKRGLELSPGYLTGYHWYALLASGVGRVDDALSLLAQAAELDPLSLPVQMAIAVTLSRAGRDAEALELYRKAIELDPGYANTYNNMAMIYSDQGRYEEALDAFAELSRLDPDTLPAEMLDEVRAGFEAGGERGFWEATRAAYAARMDHFGWAGDLGVAEACTKLGMLDEAFEHLERAIASRPNAASLIRERAFAPLQKDPRFQEIERQLGLSTR